MPKATEHHTTSRRALFSAAAALPLAALPAVALAAENPDAELLRVCAAFQADHALLLRMEAEGAPDAIFQPVNNEWWDRMDWAMETPARTAAGVRAKAAMLAPLVRNTSGIEARTPAERFALALARDVLAEG